MPPIFSHSDHGTPNGVLQQGPLEFQLVLLKQSLKPEEGNVQLDWEEMDKVVAVSRVQDLFAQETDEEEVDEQVCNVCKDKMADTHSIRAFESPLEVPLFLKPLLRRWRDLRILELAALRFGPPFPVLDPLALEKVVAKPSSRCKILCHIGNLVLDLCSRGWLCRVGSRGVSSTRHS